MYKNTLITLALLLLVSGCAEKADFTKGVSDKDKKLISSYDDKVLFVYDDIRITENGFYPNFKINIFEINNESKYATKVASYLDTKKFNLKLFIDDVKKYDLKKIRAKLLPMFKRFPTFKLEDKEELTMLLSAKNSKIVNSYIEKKTRCMAASLAKWEPKEKGEGGLEGKCDWSYYATSNSDNDSSYSNQSPSYSGSGGGYSRPSSGCRIQTRYVPGGNGRTAQVTICN